MPIAQFAPFSSVVEPAFWHELTKLKIEEFRLSDDAVPISGSYSPGRLYRDREGGADINLGCNLTVGSESLNAHPKHSTWAVSVSGILKNYNTIEEFKAADKTALFNKEAQDVWDQIITTRDSRSLTRFLLITFADLKKYKYYYWFAFPAFVAKPAWNISDESLKDANDVFTSDNLISIYTQLKSHQIALPFFLVRSERNNVTIAPIEEYDTSSKSSTQTVAFIDPSADPSNPGWPLRNLLAYLRALYPASTSTIRVLCWRDTNIPTSSKWRSRFGTLHIDLTSTESTPLSVRPNAVGWEKNQHGKLGPRMADLGPMMNPRQLVEQAVDLNLKLMRWRILPALDLEKVSSTKCLLLGAGTLGCYVARTLMGWGVRNITFVDSAHVSFSNPVRQPLFEFEDCLNGGKPKAECAAERLTKIFPGINSTGYTFSIPMPGHPIPPSTAAIEQTRSDVARLEALIDEHDAVFLLMDSRESRWLPTVIGADKGKIVMNAALGFDTFLVMRHGARATSNLPGKENPRLGCYYCNDIVAPADSLTDRTLDQMCTVTRPGLAAIAAATAVELLVSLVQHPDGIHAPAPPLNQELNSGQSYADNCGSVLGLVPHQIRGFLAQFRNLPLVGAAYDKCTGCSEAVLTAYKQQGFDMLLKAFNDHKYLETITGLDKLFDEGEALMESVNWDEDDAEAAL